MADNFHVVTNPTGGWSVRKESASRATRVFETQKEAIRYARDSTKQKGGEIFIHARNGRILERDSHLRDSKEKKG